MQFPYFYIEYSIVGTEVYLCGVCAVIFAVTFVVLAVHGVTLMRILCKLVSYATSEDWVPHGQRLSYLKSCIQLHQRIYRYCDELNYIYKIASMPYFMVMMFVNCLIIFQASMARMNEYALLLRAFIYLSAATFEMVVFCFNGQRLTTESSKIANIIYNMHWYKENKHFQYLTQLMILRSSRVVELSIGGFAKFSLVTLLAIMRSSGSYFLLLKEVNEP